MNSQSPRETRDFVLADMGAIAIDTIEYIDLSQLSSRAIITIHHQHGRDTASGIRAVEALLVLKPSALEGRYTRWMRHAWVVHNLIGHPLMQLLALLGFHRAALAVHDRTVPRRDQLKNA